MNLKGPAMEASGEIHRAARLQFFGAAARSFLLFLYQWGVAHAYGVLVFGVANLAQSGYQTATMVGRAAGDVIVLRASDEPHARAATVASAVSLSLLAGVLSALGLGVWAAFLTHGRLLSPTGLALLLASIAVPASAVLFPLGAALQREGRFRAYTLTITLVDPVIRLLAFGIALAIGAHWSAAVACITAGSAAALGVAVQLVRRTLAAARPTLQGGGGPLHLIRFSATTTIATALQTAMLLAMLTVVTALGRPTEAGVCAAAARIALLANWIQSAFAAPFLPRIPALIRAGDGGLSVTDTYRQVVSGVLWVNGPFLVAMIVAASAILGVFGADFRGGASILVVLAMAQWVNSATSLAQDFLPLSGRSGLAVLNNVGAVVLVSAGGYAVGRHYGAFGVALVSAAAGVLLNTIYSIQIWVLFRAALPLRTIGVWAACCAGAGVTCAVLAHGEASAGQLALGAVAAALTATLMWITAGAPERAALHLLLHGGRG